MKLILCLLILYSSTSFAQISINSGDLLFAYHSEIDTSIRFFWEAGLNSDRAFALKPTSGIPDYRAIGPGISIGYNILSTRRLYAGLSLSSSLLFKIRESNIEGFFPDINSINSIRTHAIWIIREDFPRLALKSSARLHWDDKPFSRAYNLGVLVFFNKKKT